MSLSLESTPRCTPTSKPAKWKFTGRFAEALFAPAAWKSVPPAVFVAMLKRRCLVIDPGATMDHNTHGGRQTRRQNRSHRTINGCRNNFPRRKILMRLTAAAKSAVRGETRTERACPRTTRSPHPSLPEVLVSYENSVTMPVCIDCFQIWPLCKR